MIGTLEPDKLLWIRWQSYMWQTQLRFLVSTMLSGALIIILLVCHNKMWLKTNKKEKLLGSD